MSSKYNIKTPLTFSEGQDGGRDAAARGVDIDKEVEILSKIKIWLCR